MVKWNDLPVEIQEKMLEEQVRQGNKRNPEIFIKSISASKWGDGFDWDNDGFWDNVIYYRNFDVFYSKYPKNYFYATEKVMLVSEDNIGWHKRVVFGEKCGRFLAWSLVDNLNDAKTTIEISNWKYAKEINSPIELTMDEIANKFGIDVNLLKIKK
jgi:hypothetical protein